MCDFLQFVEEGAKNWNTHTNTKNTYTGETETERQTEQKGRERDSNHFLVTVADMDGCQCWPDSPGTGRDGRSPKSVSKSQLHLTPMLIKEGPWPIRLRVNVV